MSESQRNFLILIGIAVVGVIFSGAFNLGAGVANMLLHFAFTVAILWFAINFYRSRSGTIAQMDLVPRMVMQLGFIALLLVVFTGMMNLPFLPEPFGWSNRAPLVFWGLVFALGFSVWWAWQQRNSRW